MLSQRRSFVLGMFLTATAGLTGCKSGEAVPDVAEDPLLVRYEDQELHFSDVQENTPFAIQSQDSAQIIAQYADRWIRERMMVKEAREKLGTSAEIDALTEKFREELQVMHYEEKLVREKLDTVISDEELMAYYKSNKSKYKLESTIFRFVFVKATKPVDDSKTLESLWKNLSSRNLQELNL
ncbi:MAG TPA: hypothetical protein VFX48_03965, partial [Saprospiraceae bacterium]|nr:hypothetical protein [Saprospiraceae bacterium]